MHRPAALGFAISLVSHTHAQTCLVSNPSFEVGFEVSFDIQGWNALNDAELRSDLTAHGRRAASIGTPGGDNWAISALWQQHDASEGTVFNGAVRVGHTAAEPLTGLARGIVNIEWRDNADQLISYESFEVLHPTDPTDRFTKRTFTTPPAPVGTASARLLLGTLQSPANETGRAVFDVAELTSPGYDDQQWGDFPSGRTIDFAGHTWRVKGPGTFGPGPNFFSDSESNVAVTPEGLDLAITGSPGSWQSSEVVIEDVLGYGDYVFTTKGKLDTTIADNVILGLFLWQYPPCYDGSNTWNQHNEIDVEISRWGDPTNDVAQFVVQPYDTFGNIEQFDITYSESELVSYAFNWLPGRVDYRAWRGGPDDESPETTLHTWTYTGQHLPTPEIPRVHINLWHLGEGPDTNQPQHVTIADFRFTPRADADSNGTLDFRDVIDFLLKLEANDPSTDLNGDGTFTTRDAVLYITEGWAESAAR